MFCKNAIAILFSRSNCGKRRCCLFKPSALSASKDTISGQKFFYTNNNPLFSWIPSSNSTPIMPGTSIVTRLSNSSPSKVPHPFQMSLPGPTSSISASTMPTRFNLFSSQSNNLRITKMY